MVTDREMQAESEKLLSNENYRDHPPEARAGVFSRWTLGFVWEYLRLPTFTAKHIPAKMPPERDCTLIGIESDRLWREECNRNDQQSPSIIRFVWCANKAKVSMIVCASLFAGVMSMVSNWLLAFLIDWFDDHNQPWVYFHSSLDALVIVLLTTVSTLITSYMYFLFEYQAYMLGGCSLL